MSIRSSLIDWSRGDALGWFWHCCRARERSRGPLRSLWTLLLCRSAQRHGGYVGPGAVFKGRPSLPHGLHGVFISRHAVIGSGCVIYQNVTVGEVGGRAPVIGDGCLLGAGAVIVGGVTVGDGARIAAGATVRNDVPAGATVLPIPVQYLGGGEGA